MPKILPQTIKWCKRPIKTTQPPPKNMSHIIERLFGIITKVNLPQNSQLRETAVTSSIYLFKLSLQLILFDYYISNKY
jgi:hypothetical protein